MDRLVPNQPTTRTTRGTRETSTTTTCFILEPPILLAAICLLLRKLPEPFGPKIPSREPSKSCRCVCCCRCRRVEERNGESCVGVSRLQELRFVGPFFSRLSLVCCSFCLCVFHGSRSLGSLLSISLHVSGVLVVVHGLFLCVYRCHCKFCLVCVYGLGVCVWFRWLVPFSSCCCCCHRLLLLVGWFACIDAICVSRQLLLLLQERLYYAALKQPPPSHNILASTPKRDPSLPKEKRQIHFFNMDQELVYWNFFLDFGPLNLGQLTRFCHKLNDKMRKFPVVCFYSSTQPAKRANAQFLICAWQVLYLKRSPSQAYSGFVTPSPASPQRPGTNHMMVDTANGDYDGAAPASPNPYTHAFCGSSTANQAGLHHSLPPISQSQGAPTVAPLPPFHDASPVACTYDLSVVDCLDGLVKAVQFGFWNIDDFDLEEYEHFEQVEVCMVLCCIVLYCMEW